MRRPLLHGVALALGAGRRTGAPPAGADAVVALALLAGAAVVAVSALQVDPPRRFVPAGLHGVATLLLGLLGFAWLVAREAPGRGVLTRLAAVLLAALSVLLVLREALRALLHRLAVGEPWAAGLAGAFLLLWGLVVVHRAIRSATGLETPRAAVFAVSLVAAFVAARLALPARALFATDAAAVRSADGPDPLDAEALLHAQPSLVTERLAALRPQRPGVEDLYLVAFGADATQSVFLNEVESVRELFDARFDTAGRSLVLANHRDALGHHPLASGSNLRDALRHLGGVLDPDEDLLFLFLTGHGGREPHELVVRFPSLPLNRIGPETLAAMLDEAGIGARVVVVSACYSGGFVEALAADEAAVVTAAAADRTSFGCRDGAAWTDFGRALFADALPAAGSFVEAFEEARRLVAEREAEAGRRASRPQVVVGDVALARLEALEARLAPGALRTAAAEAGAPPQGDAP